MGKPGTSRYDDHYYCKHCGEWFQQELALRSRNGSPRCPRCFRRVKTKPRVNPPELRQYMSV